MDNLEWSVLSLFTVVMIYCLYKFYKSGSKPKQLVELIITEKGGWCHLELYDLIQQEEVKQILFQLETNKAVWDNGFTPNIIEMIHFRDRNNVLQVATQLHSDKKAHRER